MKTNGIEDILIGESYRSTRKSNGWIIVLLLFFMLIIGGAGYAYYYHSQNEVTDKQLFISNLSKLDVSKYIKDNVYFTTYGKLFSNNSEITSEVSYSSTLKNDYFSGIDINNFTLNVKNKNNISDYKFLHNFDLNYSGNDFIDCEIIADKDKVSIISNDIVNKYVSVEYGNLFNYLGIRYNNDKISNFLKTDKVSFKSDEFSEFVKKYFTIILDNTNDSNYRTDDNIAINKNNKSISVKSYQLNLTQKEFNSVFVKFLTELKNDDKLLEKIISDKEVSSVNKNVIIPESQQVQEPIINQQIIEEEQVEENVDQSQEEFVEENDMQVSAVSGVRENLNAPNLTGYDIEKYEDKIFIDGFRNILLSKKINMTIDDAKGIIDDFITEVMDMEGNGFQLTYYVSDESLERISIIMPNTNSIEIDFNVLSNNKIDASLTYLYTGNNKDLFFINEKSVETFNGSKGFEYNDENAINGFVINCIYTKDDSSSSLSLGYNFIENKAINKKLNLKLNTEGNSGSKVIENDATITYSTNEGETKVVVDNKINFVGDVKIATLNEDNSLSLESLEPEERILTIQAVNEKFDAVYTEKKNKLNFYDVNSKSNTIDRISSSNSQKEAKQALYDKVVAMMTDAMNNGQEFTINDLKDLKIDGYQVSVSITGDIATIVVDVYTFTIDKDFNLNVK